MASIFQRLKPDIAALPTPAPLGPIPAVQATEVVVRQDLREMPMQMQHRICDAIEKMMEPGWAADPRNNIGGFDKDKSPSEYFRLARYHGWDMTYCVHGRETFPSWHRAYLVDFERTMQAADRALGRDGRIALPYWGWDRGTVNGQLLPAIIRERFSVMKPELIPPNSGSQLNASNGYRLVANDEVLAKRMKHIKVEDQVRRALSQWEHPRAASTHTANPNSVETPHNSMHVVCGWPMFSVSYAAFHPIFFLHHSNVDRLYEAYLHKDMANAKDGQNAPWVEFDKTLYNTELRPFRHPVTGDWFMPCHTFQTEGIGYRYDKLPSIPPQQLREPPSLVRFENINPVSLAGCSVELHVFVMPSSYDSFTPPDDVDDFDSIPQYGGLTGVFGSKEGECENCKTRDPIDVEVDVTDCLNRQQLSRHMARVVVVAVDMNDDSRVNPRDMGIPEPRLVGPFFENKSIMLGRVGSTQEAGATTALCIATETAQLQRYLQKYGWYSGVVDSFFGPVTEAAVRRFQQFCGLKVDGVAGPVTRGLMMMARMDDEEDEADKDDSATYAPGSIVRWWVGGCPGYLNTTAVRKEVVAALAEWATVMPLSFVEAASKLEADLVITWEDRSKNSLFRFECPCGVLASSKPCGPIILNSGEQWLLARAPSVLGAFYLQPVLLHVIGHALGLTHSSSPSDVMSPFYMANRLSLTEGDRLRATSIYPLEGAMKELFRHCQIQHFSKM